MDRRPPAEETLRFQLPSSGWSPAILVRVFRRHRRKANGCQGKGAHVLVPRPEAVRAVGCPDGGHPQATEVVNLWLSNSIRRDNSVGAIAQSTSSHQQLLTCRHLVGAMFVATWDATACSMGPMPCPHRHRPWNVSSVTNADVTHHAIEQVSTHQCRTCRKSQLRDQLGIQRIRNQTGSKARTRASGPRRPMYLHAFSQIRCSLCLC